MSSRTWLGFEGAPARPVLFLGWRPNYSSRALRTPLSEPQVAAESFHDAADVIGNGSTMYQNDAHGFLRAAPSWGFAPAVFVGFESR